MVRPGRYRNLVPSGGSRYSLDHNTEGPPEPHYICRSYRAPLGRRCRRSRCAAGGRHTAGGSGSPLGGRHVQLSELHPGECRHGQANCRYRRITGIRRRLQRLDRPPHHWPCQTRCPGVARSLLPRGRGRTLSRSPSGVRRIGRRIAARPVELLAGQVGPRMRIHVHRDVERLLIG